MKIFLICQSRINYPFSEEKLFSSESNYLIYQGDIVKHPSLDIFASICLKAPILEIFSVEDTVLKPIKRLHYGKPKVKVDFSDDYQSAITLSDNELGFKDIVTSENYIIALYSGRTIKEFGERAYMGRNLLVYDWNGNPLLNIEVEVDICSIAYDEFKHVVYAFSSYPELKLISIEIPQKY